MRKLNIYLLIFAFLSLVSFSTCDTSSRVGEDSAIENAAEDVADIFRSEQAEVQADLEEIQREIDEKTESLETDLENADESTRAEINQQIDQLETWDDEVGNWLEDLGDQTEDTWQSFKTDVDQFFGEVEDGWQALFNT